MSTEATPTVRVRWLLLLVIVAATFAAYLPATTAGFVWDDDSYVTDNRLLRDVDGLWRIWSTTETPQYYPLVFTSFWLEYRLWELNPAGYHAVNIALHALNAFLVGSILRALGFRGAWWVALLFALHPVHVESVAWITERKNVLSALFYLAALRAYLQFDAGRRRSRWWAAIILFAGALLSKTVTASLPLVALLLILWRRGRLARRDLLAVAPFFLLGIALAAITVRLEGGMIEGVGTDFELSWLERLNVAARAFLFYPMKLILPLRLSFNYPRWSPDALGWGLASAALIVVLGAVLASAWRRGRRGAGCAVLFYAVTIFPALGFLDVYPFRYSFVADHFQYLASLGPLILVVAAGVAVAGRLRGWAPAWVPRAVGATALLLLAAWTWSQAAAYHDRRTLWEDTISKNPDSWIARNNLGLIYKDLGDLEGALEQLNHAVRLKPTAAESLTGRALVFAEQRRFQRALLDLDRAVELDPTYPQARLNRGYAHVEAGSPEQAVADLTWFLEANPGHVPAYRVRARAHVALGRHELALDDLSTAIGIAPDWEVYAQRAVIHGQLRRFEPALDDFDRAIAANPEAVQLWLDRARVRVMMTGDPASACSDWNEACRLGDCREYARNCAP